MLKFLWMWIALATPAMAEDAPTPEAATEVVEAEAISPEVAERLAEMAAFEAELGKTSGVIDIGEGLVSFDTGDAYTFLGPEDAGRVLVAWGNPAADKLPLGMILPAEISIFDGQSWAITIDYEEDGYVDDADAADIDYGEMLVQMKEDARESSEWRVSEGYESLALIGWAEPPHYDADSHKLYWAKELSFGGSTDHTLNYSIRVLGRRGVLVMNAIAGMHQLEVIRPEMSTVMAATEFKEGHRYSDFDPKIDQVAAYGVGALVAGSVAAKAGLFKGLFAVMLASKKLVIGGAAVAIAFLGKLFGGNSSDQT